MDEILEEGFKENLAKKILPILTGAGMIATVGGMGYGAVKLTCKSAKDLAKSINDIVKYEKEKQYKFNCEGNTLVYDEANNTLKVNGKELAIKENYFPY